MSFPYLIITAANRRQFAAVNPQFSTGYKGWTNPDAPHVFEGSKPVGDTIPRSEWGARIKAAQGNLISDKIKAAGMKAKDQNGLGYCWVYASTRTVEIRRMMEGLPFVDLSPESVGGPCTHWRNEGGYASEAFNQLENFGACESSFTDKPHSLNVKKWKAGWQENAKKHETIDWYEIGTSFDEVVTCLLNLSPVSIGLDWWGHEITVLDPIILPPNTASPNTPDGLTVGLLCMNSWGVDWPTQGANGLFCVDESSGTPDGAASPILVTVDGPVVTPVDPTDPIGPCPPMPSA